MASPTLLKSVIPERVLQVRLLPPPLMYSILVGKSEDEKFLVFHAVYYENMPTDGDLESLRVELATDQEFGLVGCLSSMIFRTAIVEDNGNFRFVGKENEKEGN